MRERDYLPLIPDEELVAVKGLLKRIYRARGYSNDAASIQQAWVRAVAAAREPAGGGWHLDFLPSNITEAQLDALCQIIEREFFGGLISRQIAKTGRPPLRLAMGMDPRDTSSWLSGLHDNNTIWVNSLRWKEDISESNPLNFEGTMCTSKLEVLAHTLSHELVHAVVLNFWPKMDSSSSAYLPDDKHGPIFMLLSKRLLGHTCLTTRRLYDIN